MYKQETHKIICIEIYVCLLGIIRIIAEIILVGCGLELQGRKVIISLVNHILVQ